MGEIHSGVRIKVQYNREENDILIQRNAFSLKIFFGKIQWINYKNVVYIDLIHCIRTKSYFIENQEDSESNSTWAMERILKSSHLLFQRSTSKLNGSLQSSFSYSAVGLQPDVLANTPTPRYLHSLGYNEFWIQYFLQPPLLDLFRNLGLILRSITIYQTE